MIYTLTLNPALDRELTVAGVTFDTVLRATRSQVDLGGKGFNVSRALRTLEVFSTAVGFLGGSAGATLQAGLRELAIGTDFVWIAGETRTNVSIFDETDGKYIKVNELGPVVEPAKQELLLRRIDTIARPGDWWVLSGSLPPGVPAPFYARIITLLNARKAHAVLHGVGEPLRQSCAARPFLVQLHAGEVQALTGLPVDTPRQVAAAAAEVRALGARNVVVTLGRVGALLLTREAGWLIRSPEVVQKNPTGAGDALAAGLVSALSQGLPLEKSLGWAVACGAAAASRSGTEVGDRALIEHLLEQVGFATLETGPEA